MLQAHPEGLDAQGILAKIKERFEIEVARESMSPQLSRLGQDGVLARIGLIWKLAEHMTYEDLGKDETPHGYQPYGASEDEQPEGGSSDDDY